MAMKIMPLNGLFACRKDATLHMLCSMGRAYIRAQRVQSSGAGTWSFHRLFSNPVFHSLCPGRDAEPPSL